MSNQVETLSTLRFGIRAKMIKNAPTMNKVCADKICFVSLNVRLLSYSCMLYLAPVSITYPCVYPLYAVCTGVLTQGVQAHGRGGSQLLNTRPEHMR